MASAAEADPGAEVGSPVKARLLILAFLTWAVFAFVYGLVYTAASSIRAAFGHDGIHDLWFAAQRVPPGNSNAGMSCCDHSDGHILEEDQWRIADQHYQFKFGDQWITIEDSRVLPYDGANPGDPNAAGNPIGKPVVWYLTFFEGGGQSMRIYCFKPGTLS